MITQRIWISNNSIAGFVAVCLFVGCGGTRSVTSEKTKSKLTTQIATELDSGFLSNEFTSEVAEYIRLGKESLNDSEWFDAQEYFDSAMVHLVEMDTTEDLSPELKASTLRYQDSVKNWLVYAVSQAGKLGEAHNFSELFDQEMLEIQDSVLKPLGPALEGLTSSGFDLPLPIPIPSQVLQAVRVFTGHGRGYFTRWLNRKARYETMISAKIAERNLPKDLIYLAMVESGFNPKAWSHASASGIWQFIAATGKRYGLEQDWWLDARRDPLAATEAALDYLEDLYAEFGDWHLAMAAYNCGEGRVRRELEKAPGANYWNLNLPTETRNYVPKILAAMILGHHPESFGFQKNEEIPIRFDTATVRHCMPLKSVALILGITEDSLKNLNPGLRRWCTPPGRAEFLINLPEGSRELFFTNYDKIDTAALVTWRRHRVSRGENLLGLANRFGISVASIQAANGLHGTALNAGQKLIIPTRQGLGQEEDSAEDSENEKPKTSKPKVVARYKVKKGETLYDLAKQFQISVRALREANKMSNSSMLAAGKTLNIPSQISTLNKESREASKEAEHSGARKVYVINKGETLYSISRQLKLDPEDLKKWNGLKTNTVFAGKKLLYQPASSSTPESEVKTMTLASAPTTIQKVNDPRQFYRVKSGDSLWDISARFGCSIDELKKMNSNLSDVLKPGQKIRVR